MLKKIFLTSGPIHPYHLVESIPSFRGVLVDVFIFSSPEHEVLMVSYCDQSMSVVRRVSCVVNNLF